MDDEELFPPRIDDLDRAMAEVCLEKTAAKGMAEKDLKVWNQWNQTKDPQDMEVLFKQMRPVINKAVNVYAGRVSSVPVPAIQAEFEQHALTAFKTYDPNRSALHTHLTNQLKRGRRYITTYQNAARIPEARAYRVGDYRRARSALEDDLGREPSSYEIADHMKWPVAQVAKLEREDLPEVHSSHLMSDLTHTQTSQEAELLRLLPTELTGEEKIVYELITGANGKPKLNGAQIAQRTSMSPAKVSRLRQSIAGKVRKYYTP